MYERHHIKESAILQRKILHRRRDIDMMGEYEKKESSTKKKDERINMKNGNVLFFQLQLNS